MRLSTFNRIDRKSMAALIVLIIFSFSMAWLVLSKTDEAIREFNQLNASHGALIKKHLSGDPGRDQ